jgi:hypothetical protein
MSDFTPTQGRYLAYIHEYTKRHRFPPAESEIAAAMFVSAPSAHQMIKSLEKKGLILRQPGQARTIKILIEEAEIPSWKNPGSSKAPRKSAREPKVLEPQAPPAALYVITSFLANGPVEGEFAHRECYRIFEIRGDQTLEELHQAIFKAFDRVDDKHYEFQLGKSPFDPQGPNYGVPDLADKKGPEKLRDAGTTTLDDLELKQYRAFGYAFDLAAGWYHKLQVDRIEQAIPTVSYPRVIKKRGKSPPQYPKRSSKTGRGPTSSA